MSVVVLTITFLINTLFTRCLLKEIKTFNDFFPHYKLLVQVLFSFPIERSCSIHLLIISDEFDIRPILTGAEGGQWAGPDSGHGAISDQAKPSQQK